MIRHASSEGLSRRALLKGSATVLAASSGLSLVSGRAHALTEKQLFPVVETEHGKVRGVDWTGIKTFKGIRYGAPTGGTNRFMPPQPVKPWKGLFDAFDYANIAPQMPADRRSDYATMIFWDRQPGGIGEDCLAVNVWTPSVNDNARRPVLVVFHGGGFSSGSGNSLGFDGDPAARADDVVVVSVTHRLASFGFLNLAGLGAPETFKYAGVAGVMDLVAALQWVQTNIDRFGGDPNRVMIFGQSGGGAKTSTVLAMPSAKGLFHRAGVQSGSALRLADQETATKAAAALLKALDLSPKQLSKLQSLPFTTILAAQAGLGMAARGFAPVVGNDVLPHHPFDPVAPPESKDVPVIIGTTLDDAALGLTNFDLTEAELKARLTKDLGDNADRVYHMYRDTYPKVTPFLIQARIATDRGFRRSAYAQAERKSAQGGAPAYFYLWEWPAPGFDGKFGAVHGIDVGFSLHDYRGPIDGGGSAAGRLMADRFAGAWTGFARTGVPNSPATPEWPAYDAENRATMVFDTDTRVENDYRGDFRRLWDELAPRPSA